MKKEEAAANALIRASCCAAAAAPGHCLDFRKNLDELYGASIGTLVRKKGEVQLVGFYCDYVQDEWTEAGFRAPDGVSLRSCCFRRGWKTARFRLALWRAKKQNLLNAMLARINDKRTYATSQLIRTMCAGQPYGHSPHRRAGGSGRNYAAEPVCALRDLLATSRVGFSTWEASRRSGDGGSAADAPGASARRAGCSGRNDARARGKTGAGEDGAAGRDAGQAEPRLFSPTLRQTTRAILRWCLRRRSSAAARRASSLRTCASRCPLLLRERVV